MKDTTLADREMARVLLEAAQQSTDLAITELRQKLSQLATIEQNFSKAKVEFIVKTTSLWAREGEAGVSASSKYLKQAITRAGNKHKKHNKRDDFQVHWSVHVKVSLEGIKFEWTLAPQVYEDMLPGGEPELLLRLRKK